MLTHKMIVRRYRNDAQWPHGDTQRLLREVYWHDILVRRTILDEESIPPHALIDLACFSMTEWRSKFAGMDGVEFA